MKKIIRKILKEEFNNRMSREDYVDKVVEYLVDDTIIDYDDEIHFPFPTFSRSRIFLLRYSLPFEVGFVFAEYCIDNYGLTNDEIDYVWKEYRNIILDKINDKESINESIDRRDEYLNKIVDFLVDDTIIDFKENNIRFPFLPRSPSFLSDLLSPFSLVSFTSLSSFNPFSKYCKDMYGLTENEMDYVWKEYKNIILDKINNTESINESVDRMSREDYLNKILDYLVEDTIIDYEEREIKYPHLPHPSSLSFPYHSPSHFLFSEYCQVTYGLTENEMDYVWDRYKNIIWDRYKNIKLGKINEGFPDGLW